MRMDIYLKKEGKFERIECDNIIKVTTELLRTNPPQNICFIEKQNLIKREIERLEDGL